MRLQKHFILSLSAAQVTATARSQAIRGRFLGPVPANIAKTVLPKLLPVLGTLGIAVGSGAISGATKKAMYGDEIKQLA